MGRSGYPGAILSSTDGVTWTSRTSGTTVGLHGITYGNGRFVTVGDAGVILQSDAVVSAAPAIAFARSTKLLLVSWPTNLTLQSTARFSATNSWSSITNTPSVSNGRNTLTIDTSIWNQFLRLFGAGL